MTLPPDELLDERSDPHVRSVLEDWAIERSLAVTRLGVACDFVAVDYSSDDDIDADDSEVSAVSGDTCDPVAAAADVSDDAADDADTGTNTIDTDTVDTGTAAGTAVCTAASETRRRIARVAWTRNLCGDLE